jgi:hypothetical protein
LLCSNSACIAVGVEHISRQQRHNVVVSALCYACYELHARFSSVTESLPQYTSLMLLSRTGHILYSETGFHYIKWSTVLSFYGEDAIAEVILHFKISDRLVFKDLKRIQLFSFSPNTAK